jgi:predicted ATPase
MRQQQQQADDTSGTAASSADPLVLCWRESRLSEKLFARPEEENILLHAYERLRKTTRRSEAVNCSNADSRQPSTVVWMPSSQAGLGQTTLVQSLQRKVHRDGGSFLYIQCDKGCEPDPHAPIVKALSRWASSCHASTSRNSARDISRLAERLEQGLTQKERGFLSDTVPEFKKLLKSTCSESTASLYSWKKRANLLQRSFAKLTYALAGTERPHVLVLEDLHLGNEVILDMLSCLLRAQDLRDFERPFLLVVTYRQDPDLYMSTCIDQLKNRLRRSQIEQMMIRLEAFTPDVLGSRMNEYMDVEDAAAVEALCRDGVPFLVEKRLENLASEQMLTLDVSMNIWTLHSDAQKHSSLPCTLTFCLDTISDDLLQFLRIFACLGVRTSRTVLEESRASDVLEDHLVLAVDSGLIICSDEERGEFSFSHEAVRDVVYQGIPIEEQPKFHYQIAENLWLSFDIQELDEYLLVVMDHLQKGRNCIPSERRKAAAAQLCLRAGEQMAEVTAYNTAYYCFSLGIEMLPDGWKSEYRLCLALHTFACEVAYCIARFDDIHRIAGAVIANARSFNDALRVQISKIYTIGSSEDCHKSLQYGDALLAQIGKAVGLRPSKRQASLAYVRCYRRLKGLTNEKILRLPAMDDPEKLAAMQILNSLLPSLFSVDHYLGPIVIDQMIRLSLEHGVSALSGVAFGLFATFQCW